MHLTFTETMRGTWAPAKPGERPGRFDFTCTATTDEAREFLRTRGARIAGTVTMEGVGEGLPLDGTMRIDPVLGREIVYDFTFRAQGSLYRFLGRKDVRPADPLRTMTTLKGQLTRDGVTVGAVESRFVLRELPGFLASFRLGL